MKCANASCQRENAPGDKLCAQCRLHERGDCACPPAKREPWATVERVYDAPKGKR